MPDFDMDLELDGIVQYDVTTGMGDMPDFDINNAKRKNVPLDPFANSNKSTDSTNSPSKQSTNNSSKTTYLPPPPSLNQTSSSNTNSSILPPPPTLSLGQASSGGISLPSPLSLSLQLPAPPTLNLQLPQAPALGLTLPAPPSLGNVLPSPPSLSLTPINPPAGGGISNFIFSIDALLSQLNNPNPMARLKKTVTLEKGGVNPTVEPPTNDNADKPPR